MAVASLRDSGREIIAVGNFTGVQPGETLRLAGRWTVHPKFGGQFQVESFSAVAPATLVGIERYLGSGLVAGIGKELAARLVARFGLETLDVIDAKPQRLREVEGIGPKRSRQILEAWKTQKGIRDVMVFLQSYGVSTGLASRIFRQYGAEARAALEANPYRLAVEIEGIGFATADKIAKNLGIPPGSPHRVEAGVLHALGERAEEGDVIVPRTALTERSAALLSLDLGACEAAISALAARGQAVLEETPGEGATVGLPRLVRAERECARLLAGLAAAPSPRIIPDIDAEIARHEARSGMKLSPLQREAVARALRDKVLVVTGGPGTGKTTLVTAIVRILEGHGARVALCAPTGRAAKRMAEATGHEARTIHRLLESSPKRGGFTRGAENPIPCDACIVDETSMIDVSLFHALLDAVPLHAALVLVGDADQLPSVGPGSVLADLLSSAVVPVVRLTEIFRQAEASAIVVNAHRINAGLMPESAGPGTGDFFFIERSEPADILQTLRELVTARIPRRFGLDPRQDVQVLTPMRKGELGVGNLNRELQSLLNPTGPALQRGAAAFRAGDRVMQVRNNYDLGVFNGDIGRVVGVQEAERALVVGYDERNVRYEAHDMDELVHAYACSIHKSQGNEFPAVVVVLHTQHFVLLRRNLLYTAVTRGRKLAVVVGSRKALALAVKNAGAEKRSTGLARRLREAFASGGHFPYRGPSAAQAL